MKKLLIIMALSLNLPIANAAPAITDNNNRTISSSGHGEVEIPQKIALISLTVNETAKKPQEAQEQARQKFEQVISAVRQVPTLAIYSSMVSVTPNWSYADNQSRITGYTANYSIQVKSTITNSGTIIDKAVANGASIVGNPQLSATDKDRTEAQLQAIKQATQDAKTRAEASLATLGLKTKSIKQIILQNETPPRPLVQARAMAMKTAAADNSIPATEVIAGTDMVTAEVTLVLDY